MTFRGFIKKPRMSHRFLHLLLLSVLPVIIGSCKRQNTAEQATVRTLYLLTAQGQRPYELAQAQYLARLVFARDGFELKTLDAKGDANIQARQFDEALKEKPVALLITPVESEALVARVSSAVQSGITVIGLGESAAPLPCSTVLQVGQKELGLLAGELTVRALTRKAEEEGKSDITGRVVELREDENRPVSQARHEGFIEALQKVPGIVLVHDAPASYTQQGAKDRIKEAMRLQSQFDVIYAHNDSMALGAASTLGDLRANVLVIGTDGFLGEEGGLTLVNQGDIDATIHHPPLVDLAWQIIKRRIEDASFAPKPGYRLSGLTITPKNVTDIMRSGPPATPAL